jgi:hypothetical protein
MLDPKWGGWAPAQLDGSDLDQREVIAASTEWSFAESSARHEWFELRFEDDGHLSRLTKRRRLWPFSLLVK